MATLAHRGLAKVLEDRAEFEVVADIPPETVREKVFLAAATERRCAGRAAGHRTPFRREAVLEAVAQELGLEPERVAAALFADLKDENRMLRFDDLDAQRLIDRYNVALAQAVLLRSVLVDGPRSATRSRRGIASSSASSSSTGCSTGSRGT